MCSQPWTGVQRPQYQRGGKPAVSKRPTNQLIETRPSTGGVHKCARDTCIVVHEAVRSVLARPRARVGSSLACPRARVGSSLACPRTRFDGQRRGWWTYEYDVRLRM